MKRQSDQSTTQQIALLTAGLITVFSSFGIGSLDWLAWPVQLALPFLLGVAVYYVIYTASRVNPSVAVDWYAKVVSKLIIVSVIGCLWFAIQSLWVPSTAAPDRFALQNIATGLLLFAGVATLVLSGLQRDIFWFTKRDSKKLDERETTERRKIFEKSYRLSVLLTAATLWGYMNTVDSLPAIRELNIMGDGIPGHYFFPAYCLIIILVALPPILATIKKR